MTASPSTPHPDPLIGPSAQETIGLMADRGLPAARLQELRRDLLDAAASREDGVVPSIEFKSGTLPMDDTGAILFADSAPGIMRDHGWDRMVYLTDLPLTTEHPVISQTVARGTATMLCLPAFGLLRAKDGLRQEMTRLIRGLPAGAGVRVEHLTEIEGGDADADVTRVLKGRGRTIRLLLGMIRANRPDQLARTLSGCLATGAAAGGFGIFYGAVWEMSNLTSIARLCMLTVLSIVSLTAWLIFHNRLWNPWNGQRHRDPVAWWRARLDNIATVGTVGLAASGIYVILFILMLLVSVVLVPADFFASRVHHRVGMGDYLTLAWFTATLGTLGGALGSGFDSDSDIQEATYNRRELRRRQITGLFD